MLSGRHFVVSLVVSHFWPIPVLVKLLGLRENMKNLVCRMSCPWSKKAIPRVLSIHFFVFLTMLARLVPITVKPGVVEVKTLEVQGDHRHGTKHTRKIHFCSNSVPRARQKTGFIKITQKTLWRTKVLNRKVASREKKVHE